MSNAQPENVALLNMDDAAAFLGIARQTLYHWKSKGIFNCPHVLVGSRPRYKVEDLIEFANKKRVVPAEGNT